jgi:beta-N-acetylhexosaminidase
MTFSNNITGSEARTVDKVHSIIRKMVESGAIRKERIDESYYRIIKLKMRLVAKDEIALYKQELQNVKEELAAAKKKLQEAQELANTRKDLSETNVATEESKGANDKTHKKKKKVKKH